MTALRATRAAPVVPFALNELALRSSHRHILLSNHWLTDINTRPVYCNITNILYKTATLEIENIYSQSESVHVGVDDHQHKGHDEVEDEPEVNHLDVGGGR